MCPWRQLIHTYMLAITSWSGRTVSIRQCRLRWAFKRSNLIKACNVFSKVDLIIFIFIGSVVYDLAWRPQCIAEDAREKGESKMESHVGDNIDNIDKRDHLPKPKQQAEHALSLLGNTKRGNEYCTFQYTPSFPTQRLPDLQWIRVFQIPLWMRLSKWHFDTYINTKRNEVT